MGIEHRTITIGDINLAITEAGSGGRPLLLVHGYTGSRTDFDMAFEGLAEAGWHVVAPDLRGHGGSSHPPSEADYTLDHFAADVLALAKAMGFDRFAILGHSMGGMIAQHLVLGAPDRIDAVVLMDTSHGPLHVDPELVELGVNVARADGMEVVADIMGASDDGPLTTDAYRRMVAKDPSYAERGDRNLRASSAAMFAAMLAAIPQQTDRLEALTSLAVPVLVIVGEEDAPFLDDSGRMADRIPGARLAVIPGGGHSPQFEATEAWWDALSGFLAELPLAPSR